MKITKTLIKRAIRCTDRMTSPGPGCERIWNDDVFSRLVIQSRKIFIDHYCDISKKEIEKIMFNKYGL